MKKIVTLFLALMFATSLFAGGQQASDDADSKKLAVGIVLPTKDEPRWIQDETRFKEAFDKAGYSVDILFSQGDSARERSNVEALIAKGVKVIILSPQDSAAAAAAAEEAARAGVKVISYDRLIMGTDAVDMYISFSSFDVGKAWGEYLISKASGTGNNLFLYAGGSFDNNAFIFFDGAWSVLQPKIADGTFVVQNSSEAVKLSNKNDLSREELAKIIGQVDTDWTAMGAKNKAESNLTAVSADAKGEVFIVAPNDNTSRAIGDTFAADGDVTKFYITGQDVEPASVQYIIDGKQSMTVFKDVRFLVSDALKAAVTYLEGNAPTATGLNNNGVKDVPTMESAVTAIDIDNLNVLFDSGYVSASDFSGL